MLITAASPAAAAPRGAGGGGDNTELPHPVKPAGTPKHKEEAAVAGGDGTRLSG